MESKHEGSTGSHVEVSGGTTSWQNEIARGDFSLGMQRYLEALGIEIKVVLSPPETTEVFKSGRALVLLPHTNSLEVAAAIAAIGAASGSHKSRNVKLMAESTPEDHWLFPFVLPIYNSDHGVPLNFFQKINRLFHPKKKLPPEEALGRNAQTLRRAKEEIASGSLVVLCPEGTGDKNGPWQRGVAGIIKLSQLKSSSSTNKETEASAVFCEVKGIGLPQLLARRFLGKLLPSRIDVRFSDPIKFSNISTEGKLDDVAEALRQEYLKWLAS